MRMALFLALVVAAVVCPLSSMQARDVRGSTFLVAQRLPHNPSPDERAAGDRKVLSILQEVKTTPAGSRYRLVPALLEALTTSSQHMRHQAAAVFRDEPVETSVSAFVKCVQSGLGTRKQIAAEILNQSAMYSGFVLPKADVPVLANVLSQEKDSLVKRPVASLLGRVTSELPLAKEALMKALSNDKDPEVRVQCAMSLGQVGREEYAGNTASTIQALCAALGQDSSDRVRAMAAASLGQMGEKGSAGATALREALKDNSSSVRGSALYALALVGPKASLVLPQLIEILDGPNENLGRGGNKYLAVQVLASLREAASPAVPQLRSLLKEEHLQQTAAYALGRMGKKAAPAVPDLIELLYNPYYDIREAAANALGNIGPPARSALPALREAAQDTRNARGGGTTVRAQKAAEDAIMKLKRDLTGRWDI